MTVTQVLEQLTRAVVTFEAEDGQLHLRALLDERPLTEETLALCRAHKPELLAYLDFAEEADSLLMESTRRLAKAWPDGCQLEDDPRWDQAEHELHDAHWSLDLSELQKAIETREQLALEMFGAFKKERAR